MACGWLLFLFTSLPPGWGQSAEWDYWSGSQTWHTSADDKWEWHGGNGDNDWGNDSWEGQPTSGTETPKVEGHKEPTSGSETPKVEGNKANGDGDKLEGDGVQTLFVQLDEIIKSAAADPHMEGFVKVLANHKESLSKNFLNAGADEFQAAPTT